MRIAVVLFVSLLTACSDEASPASDASVDAVSNDVMPSDVSTDSPTAADVTAPKDASPQPDAGTKSAGCGTTPPHTANYTGSATDGKNVARTYAVMLPSPYDAEKPLALTFGYHGAGGTSANGAAFGIQGGAGASASSIFVFPQGIAFQSYGVGWDDGCGGYDMPFFDNMLSDIESHYCIDTNRIFVAGFSWGCDQVTALTCCRGDRIRAVSAASCTDEFGNASDYTTYDNPKCPTSSHAGIRFTHDSSGGDSAYAKPLFATTSKLYQSFNGCPTFGGTIPSNACHAYAGCSFPFVECPYDNLGHATPPNWGADTWSFFDSFK